MKINQLHSYALIKPEMVGEMVCVQKRLLKRILHRIAYLSEVYIPVSLIFTTWIALVYFGAEYLNKH